MASTRSRASFPVCRVAGWLLAGATPALVYVTLTWLWTRYPTWGLVASAHQAFDTWIGQITAYVICSVSALLAVGSIRTARALHRVDRATHAIQTYRDDLQPHRAGSSDISTCRHQMGLHLPHRGRLRTYLDDAWMEFREGFVKLGERDIWNTYPADHFLTDEGFRLALPRPNARWIRGWATMATSIGMLGTFVGIALGLGQIDTHNVGKVTARVSTPADATLATGKDTAAPATGMAIEPPSAATQGAFAGSPTTQPPSPAGETGGASTSNSSKSLEGVIQGLAAAFWTSILGLLAALAMGLFAASADNWTRSSLEAFRNEWDRLLPRMTTESLMVSLVGVTEQFGKTVVKSEQPPQDFRAELRAAFSAQAASLEGLQRSVDRIADDVAEKIGTEFSTAVKQNLVPAIDRLSEVAAEQVRASAEAGTSAAQQMVTEVTATLTEGLAQATSDVADTMERSRKQTEALVELVDRSVAQSAAQLDASQEAAALIQRQLDRLQEHATLFTSITSDLVALDAKLGLRQATTLEMADRIVKDVAEVSDTFAKEARALEGALVPLSATVERLRSAMDDGGDQLLAAAELIDQASDKLGARSRAEAALLRGFQATLSQLEARTSGLSGVAGAIERVASSLQSTTELLGPLGGDMAAAAARLTDVSRSLGPLPQRVAAMVQELGLSAGALTKLDRDTRDYAEGLVAALAKNTKAYDEQLLTLSRSMSAAINELVDGFEELYDAMRAKEQEPGTPGVALS